MSVIVSFQGTKVAKSLGFEGAISPKIQFTARKKPIIVEECVNIGHL